MLAQKRSQPTKVIKPIAYRERTSSNSTAEVLNCTEEIYREKSKVIEKAIVSDLERRLKNLITKRANLVHLTHKDFADVIDMARVFTDAVQVTAQLSDELTLLRSDFQKRCDESQQQKLAVRLATMQLDLDCLSR